MTRATDTTSSFSSRTERFAPRTASGIQVELQASDSKSVQAHLSEISASGLQCLTLGEPGLPVKTPLSAVRLRIGESVTEIKGALVRRIERVDLQNVTAELFVLGVSFDSDQEALIETLKEDLSPAPYVRDELAPGFHEQIESALNAAEHTVLDFFRHDSPNLFAKCEHFYEMIKDLQKKQLYQTMYRVTLTSGLDHRIVAFNPITRREEELICFDSNSYFTLHKHPRVIEAVEKALKHVGYGTPSAQLLCGTNRYLRELEETISHFHGREDALIFPSGYGANAGILSALVRKRDLVVRDRFSHASIHDPCRASDSRYNYVYPHKDMARLEKILQTAASDPECMGKLVVTDGVFSMHGQLAPLPEISRISKKYGACLMVDEAHSVGVIGPNGKGTEDYFGLPGSIDVLMGTFSKAPGTAGGYVCGKREMIYYLRFYANPAVFTASLPAATCAGVTEAFRIMEEEPEHRQKLWENIRTLAPALQNAGFVVSEPESPILTVFMGTNPLLWAFSRDLFLSGVKCGNVSYPAVPNGEAILRFAVNARHTPRDLQECVEIMTRLGRKYGILGKSKEEIRELGNSIRFEQGETQ